MTGPDGLQPARRNTSETALRARLSRRSILRMAGVMVAGTLSVPILGSCNNSATVPPTQDAETPAPSPSTSTPTPVPPLPRTPVATPGPPVVSPTPAINEGLLTHGLYHDDPISYGDTSLGYLAGEPALWSGLLTLDTEFEVTADWSIAWWSNSEATQWTFVLRQGNAGWSNGEPVTAHDFVSSWQRIVNPDSATPHAWLLYDIVNATEIREGTLSPDSLGVVALDDWTLEVNLVAPSIYFPAIAAAAATVPKHSESVAQLREDWSNNEHPITNGPFSLNGWERGTRFQLQRNEQHWNAPRVSLDQVVARIIVPEEQVSAYEAREIHFAALGPSDLIHARTHPLLADHLRSAIEPAIWFVVPGATTFPFSSLEVRKAIGHAIDRERLVQITQGRVQSAQCLIPPQMPGHTNDTETTALQQFDVDRAIEALGESMTGEPADWPLIPFLLPSDDEIAAQVCADIAAQLFENLGIQIILNPQEPAQYRETLRAGAYGLAWARWSYHYADPNNGYHDAFSDQIEQAIPLTWSDPYFDDLLERGRREQNKEIRIAIYQECERLLQRQAAYIPVAYPVSYYLVRPWIRNLPTSANGQMLSPHGLFTRITSVVDIDAPAEN